MTQPVPRPARRGLPLSVVLLAVLLTLVAGIAAIVIWQNYRKSVEEAMSAGRQMFGNLSTDVALQQNAITAPVEVAITSLAQVPLVGRIDAGSVSRAFRPVLDAYPQVTTIRIGFADGNVTDVSREAMPPISGDPRPTAWYLAATAAPGTTVATKPYRLSNGQPGISIARTLSGADGVMAADIELKQFSLPLESLSTEPDEQMFLFTADQKLFAHYDFSKVVANAGDTSAEPILNGVETLTHPAAIAIVAAYRAGGPFSTRQIMAAGRPYLAAVTRLGSADDGAARFFAFALPESTFTGVFIAIGRDAVVISLFIMLASIPIIILVARALARPLKELAMATDRIAQLDLAAPVSQPTRIREIARLGDSLDRMKSALSQMAKYVPKALVQDLIGSGMAADVGGERRELSFMFTDVRDFTAMAETLPAEALMAQMSQYFDGMVSAILERHGTVDKYIGVAVFAFWNAPLLRPEHPDDACLAALACRAASNRMNAAWQSEGRPIWHTRIGVHLGEAVVGNVGSRDRVDYTAIGNAVNIASRLEGLNKVYGTQVVVSGQIVARVRERFLVRRLDAVLPKGAAVPLEVYELIGTLADGPYAVTAADRTRAQAWEEIMAAYGRRDWKRTAQALTAFSAAHRDDEAAQALLERVTGFLTVPPPPDWDGVTRIDSK